MAKKKPPMKLVWLDLCRAWIIGDTERVTRVAELPDGVSLVAAQAVISILMSVAASDGTGCMASAKWIGERTATNRTRVGSLLAYLVEDGWIDQTGRVRSKQANMYDLGIPPGIEAGDQRWDGSSHLSSAQNGAFSPPKVGRGVSSSTSSKVGRGVSSSNAPLRRKGETEGETTRPPPSPQGEEESGTNVPLSLSAVEVNRLRGVMEQVAANRPSLDAENFNASNTDLQQEWHRLNGGGWVARTIDVALAHPRNIKSSETGWLLSQFRDLPTNPDEDARVIETQVLLLTYLSHRNLGNSEHLPSVGLSVEEYGHLIDQAKAHDFMLEDGTWTEDGLRLARQAEVFQNSDDFQSSGDYYDSDDIYDSDDDPKWSLVHQALKVKSKPDVVYSAVEVES